MNDDIQLVELLNDHEYIFSPEDICTVSSYISDLNNICCHPQLLKYQIPAQIDSLDPVRLV